MNNKGFAISVILYSIVFLIVTIMFMLLGIVKTRYTVNDKLKENVIQKIYDIPNNSTTSQSSHTCNITGSSNSYTPNLVLSIIVSDNKGSMYSFDGINYSSSNQVTVDHSGTYTGYFIDLDGGMGSCSAEITSKTMYRYQNCSSSNTQYSDWTRSTSFTNDCEDVSNNTFRRECAPAGGNNPCGNPDGSTCFYKIEYRRSITGCNWSNETSNWSEWSTDSQSTSSIKRSETQTGYKIR